MLNRLLRRLSGRHEDDLAQLTRAIRTLAATQREQMAAMTGQLAALSETVAQRATARDANEILQGVRAATVLIGKGTAEGGDAHARLYQSLDAIAKGSGPIVVGPWTGEVGFELLYWIPFVDWFRTRWRVAADRLVIVSRGGTEAWYGTAGARYVDIFSLMPPESFRARTDPHEHKQREVSTLDEEIVESIRRQIAVADAPLLHPRLMYRLFAPYWRDEAGFGLIDRFTSHRRIGRVDDPIVEGLPDGYVAARFYFSDCFPDTAANRAFAGRIIGDLASRVPVVLLNPGVRVDDHGDTIGAATPVSLTANILSIADRLTPERNLAAQTAVIARARSFVGTYGGYSYLAPLCGVPAVGFYSDRDFKLHHLNVAQRVFDRLGAPTVIAVDTQQAEWVGLLLGGEGARGKGEGL